MAKRTPKVSIYSLMASLDLPNLRDNGTWLQTGPAPQNRPGFCLERLVFYGEKLRDLGMSDTDIVGMFQDLYWDAVNEIRLKDKASAGS